MDDGTVKQDCLPESSAGARIQSALSDRLKLVQYFRRQSGGQGREDRAGLRHHRLAADGFNDDAPVAGFVSCLRRCGGGRPAFPLPLLGERLSDPALRQDGAKAMVDWLLTEWPD
ncbi:MAG: hypothetical protein IPN48_05100 [Sphingomonadales bacterium]|nr:hypothetical protein [Sphingomonadales bacterium]